MNNELEKIEEEELMNIEGGESRSNAWLGEKIQLVWNFLFVDN